MGLHEIRRDNDHAHGVPTRMASWLRSWELHDSSMRYP